jgi:DNA repair exonuclease SbcCD nuclease subunit
MSKHLITGDLHLGSHGKLKEDISFEVLEWIYEVADEHEVDTFELIGDIFKKSNPTDTVKSKLISTLLDRKGNDVSTRYLVGNHDFYLKSGFNYKELTVPQSAADILSEIKKSIGDDFHVISSPSIIETKKTRFYYYPFGSNYTMLNQKIYEDINNHEGESDIVLIGHFQIANTRRDNNTLNKQGVDIKLFDKKNLYGYFGHFHTRQKFYNSMYVGSPYQQKIDEFGDKGIWIVEFDKGIYVDSEFILNDFSPRFTELIIDLENNTMEVRNSHVGKLKKNPKIQEVIDSVEGNVLECIFKTKSISSLETFLSENERFIESLKETSYSFSDRTEIVKNIEFTPTKEVVKSFSQDFIEFIDQQVELEEIKEMAKDIAAEVIQ